MKILYIGELFPGGTCLIRMQTLERMGHQVVGIDTSYSTKGLKRLPGRIIRRILRSMNYRIDFEGVNVKVRAAVSREKFDVVWVDKGLTVKPSTLRFIRQRLPNSVIVAFSNDDMMQRHNQSVYYLASIPLYDIHFTTKTFNVPEMLQMKAKRAYFIGNAYDPFTHRPIPVSERDRMELGGPVGFIGDFEPERANAMLMLAEAGIPVRIWGWNNWRKFRRGHPLLRIEFRPLLQDQYAKGICSFDINLGFLRKINRDLQTLRSIEIPACGAFMLAERTEEHQALFKEGEEAEFFDSPEELIQKTRYYLDHPERRKEIALAGLKRCKESGYDNQSRMSEMLDHISNLRAGSG